MIHGTYEITSTGAPRTSSGEAGLEHLIHPLNEIRFNSVVSAALFAVNLLDTTYGKEVIVLPKILVNNRIGKRCQGRYFHNRGVIEIASHLRLRTVIHELAHHVAQIRHDQYSGHRGHFKVVLSELLQSTYRMLKKRTPRKKKLVVKLPRVGTKVQVKHKKINFSGVVIKRNRVNCKVEHSVTGQTWTCAGPSLIW